MAQEVPAGTTINEHKPTMAEKMKLGIANVKTRFSGTGSNPTTPRTPTSPKTFSGTPTGDVAEDSVPLKKTESSKRETLPSAPDGGRVGDKVSPTAGPSSISRREGEPAKPKLPMRDLGERIMEKLPFSHTNPYSVGHSPSMPEPATTASPYVSETESMPRRSGSPRSHSPTTATSPGIVGKLKNMVTGQKPSQGTATDNATSGTTGTAGAATAGGTHEGYAQSPKPQRDGDLYDRVREAMSKQKAAAAAGSDTGSEELWPTPTKPATTPEGGATFADEKGHPIEGPTQPMSEDTKKEGLMTKLVDKLQINQKGGATTTTGSTGSPKAQAHTHTST